jgi:hypothetical protein
MDNVNQKQSDTVRWQVAGHEVLYDRSTFRHKAYRKDFERGTYVKYEGVPFITSVGKALKTEDLFPERADLCLDSDANVVSQMEFEKRYRQFLEWFTWVESTDVSVEPVPDVLDYLSQTSDSFSESRGLVTIGYDARKPAEDLPTHKYDPNSDKLVEIVESQAVMTEALKLLLEKNLNKPGPGRPKKSSAEEAA